MDDHFWNDAADGERERAAAIVDEVAEMLVATADPEWGGWGARQKFPHPDALHFLLVRGAETRDARLLDLVAKTLRSMQRAEIHDAVEGGFYRFATQPDWSVPNHEKPLLSNAKRLLAYAEAHQVLGGEDLRETALATAAWMRSTLLDPHTGAFGSTQDADPVYARLTTRAAREAHGAPPVDRTVHADRNAWAAIGFLKAGFVFDDGNLTETGLGALRFVLEHMVDPVRGVHHYWNGSPNQPGDLVDQAVILRAIVEAAHSGGTNEFLAQGIALAALTDERLSAEDGSFRRDPFQDPQPARARTEEELKSNAVMAEALIRLGILAREPRWAARGRAALMAFADAWRPHGFATAGFGRALHLIAREPIHVVVVGDRSDDRTRALADAARRTYVASRVAQTVDPAREPGLAAALGLEPLRSAADGSGGFEGPFAALWGKDHRTPFLTDDPRELASQLGRDQETSADGR